MVTGADIIQLALLQVGKKYIFGVEDDGKANPAAFDCSELVQWVCQQLHVSPAMVDGSGNQLVHCQKHGMGISVDAAKKTPGALVFMRDPHTHGIHHVAISMGDSGTVEARGKDYGVVTVPWRKGFTDAGRIPGVQY